MSGRDVLDVLATLSGAGLQPCLDGGWAVDAAVGRQTRPHDDLDLGIPAQHVPAAIAALAPSGFAVTVDARPTRLVLSAPDDRRIDIHPLDLDAAGDGWQRLPDGNAFRYPASALAGGGVIDGVRVPCLTVAFQIVCHDGYELDAVDRHDLRLLRALLANEPA